MTKVEWKCPKCKLEQGHYWHIYKEEYQESCINCKEPFTANTSNAQIKEVPSEE